MTDGARLRVGGERCLESIETGREQGSWEVAFVDMVPERVALSVSQLEPDVRAADDDAAVPECRRVGYGMNGKWGFRMDAGEATT